MKRKEFFAGGWFFYPCLVIGLIIEIVFNNLLGYFIAGAVLITAFIIVLCCDGYFEKDILRKRAKT